MAQPAEVRERATRTGRDWARTLIGDVLGDGRALEGGFPGTLSEARMRALGDFEPQELDEPVGTEIVRLVYTAARAGWAAGCRSQLISSRS
jgi:hypothetical protein